MAYDVPQLLQMSNTDLDSLFSNSPAGDIPDGPAKGTAIIAPGTKFSVDSDGQQSGVAVTQGKVQVSGIDTLLYAGQQLAPGGRIPQTAPRASYQLQGRQLVR